MLTMDDGYIVHNSTRLNDMGTLSEDNVRC
jgi:hypothetical protein